jgi:acetyltransferase-like isoleucine patch superfamily enzyme
MWKEQFDKFLIVLYERAKRKKENRIWDDIIIKFKSLGSIIYIGADYKILNPQHISVGTNFSAGVHFRLEAVDKYNAKDYYPKIVIGNNVSFEDHCHVGCINSIMIEDNVMIASKVIISDHFHGEMNLEELKIPPRFRKLYSKGPIIIKRNVWIGDNVSVLSNVIIGENSVIGSNSVVTKDIPANSIAAGVPARIIKQF